MSSELEIEENLITLTFDEDNLTETKKAKRIHVLLFISAAYATLTVFFILFFLFYSAGSFFAKHNILDFLFGDEWFPYAFTDAEETKYGAFNLIMGTLLVSFGAMVIAIPLGISTAVFIAEISPPKLARFMKGAVEILAGIPSIVYGYFGMLVLNKWIRETFHTMGASWLSGSIILAIMALPTIVSVSEDALSVVPKAYREGSLAMGSTRWQTTVKVVIPAAISGISAAIILGLGRAIGETMAVVMLTGNNPILPEPLTNIFSPIATLTGTIALEMGEATGDHQKALFALGIVLFAITLIINVLANLIMHRLKRKFQATQKKKRIKSPIKISPKSKLLIRRVTVLIFLIALVYSAIWVLNSWFVIINVRNGLVYTLIIITSIVSFLLIYKKLKTNHQQKLGYAIIYTATSTVILMLVIIVSYIVIQGIPALISFTNVNGVRVPNGIREEFLTEGPKDLGRRGGILPAIIGSLLLVGGAVFYAIPLGIGAGIYLSEYSKDNRFTKFIRSGIDNLNGTPSIVFGLFGFAFFVIFIGLPVSMLVGQIVLALMILPTIIRTTEEALKAIPNGFREGSLALGATKWQTIKKVVLPAAIPGIITGIILGMGRVLGETAPILFTAVVFRMRYLPRVVTDPVMAITFHLYVLLSEVPNSEVKAGGTALVLLLMVVMIYSIGILLRNRYKKKKKW